MFCSRQWAHSFFGLIAPLFWVNQPPIGQGEQFGATVEIVKQSVQSVSEELDSTVEELGTLADAAEARSTCLADISERAGGKADETCA